MEEVINFFRGTLLLLWAILRSIVEPFIPARFLHKNVKGQIVLITGAGSGFGRLMARNFALRHGAIIVLWDINKAGMEETAKIIKAGGGRSFSYVVDVSSRETVYATAKKVLSEVGKVNILVNNAGIGDGELLLNFSDELLEKTYKINTLSHYWITKAFLPGMLEEGFGHIVTISSGAGLFGVPLLSTYCGTKHAAVGFHETITSEFKMAYPKAKLETTLICPYFVRTPIIAGKEDRIKSTALLQIRDPEPVVDEFMDAILTNQKMLIPSYGVRFLLFLKGNLPSRVMQVLTDMALKDPIAQKPTPK